MKALHEELEKAHAHFEATGDSSWIAEVAFKINKLEMDNL